MLGVTDGQKISTHIFRGGCPILILFSKHDQDRASTPNNVIMSVLKQIGFRCTRGVVNAARASNCSNDLRRNKNHDHGRVQPHPSQSRRRFLPPPQALPLVFVGPRLPYLLLRPPPQRSSQLGTTHQSWTDCEMAGDPRGTRRE